MTQGPERSSSELRASANWHLRRAGLRMIGGLAVVTAGVFGRVAIKDIDQGWHPILQAVGESAPTTAAVLYLWYARKPDGHIQAAMADRRAAKALDRQPPSVLELPPVSLAAAHAVPPQPEVAVPTPDALPDNQLGVSEVVIPRALIQSLDEQR